MSLIPHRERIAAWIAALRSGAYQQGQGVLQWDDNHFCCLGVACDLHAKAVGDEWRRAALYEWLCYRGNSSLMPLSVAHWYGLEDIDPLLGDEAGIMAPATAWNDGGPGGSGSVTFQQIADMLEAKYLRGDDDAIAA